MKVDVCVIGAGPAGLAAATGLVRFGARVVVVDEMPEVGGRLLGQLHRVGHRNDRFHQNGWWDGRRVAGQLEKRALEAGVDTIVGHSVWGVFPNWQVCLSGDEPRVIEAERLIIASGATERAVPVPGWDLPGVMSIGAAQVLTTQHRVRPGNRVLVAGIDPLSMAIAHELQLGDVEVAGIVNLPPNVLVPGTHSPIDVIGDLARVAHLAPSPLLRRAGWLGRLKPLAGLAARLQPLFDTRVWGIPVQPRLALVRIYGDTLVEGAALAPLAADGSLSGGPEIQVEVDAVALAGGLRPLTELCDLLGCEVVDIPDLGGSIPLHGFDYQTTTPGVYVAGNITGIESAMVALAQGQTVAAAIAAPERLAEFQRRERAARRASPIAFLPDVSRGRARLKRAWNTYREGGDVLVPHTVLSSRSRQRSTRLMTIDQLSDDLVICRCEDVTLGDLRRAVRSGFETAEELKRFTRVTMGPCQGRTCSDLLAAVQAGIIGDRTSPTPFPRHRPPIRPVSLADLAALATGKEEWERLHGTLLPSLPFDAPNAGGIADPDR